MPLTGGGLAGLSANSIAMKWGDHCWLKGLAAAPHLNGRHVVLDMWLDEKQRWRVAPHGWKHSEEYIGVKPANLSNEPPARVSEESFLAAQALAKEQKEQKELKVRTRLADNVAMMQAAEEVEHSDDDDWEVQAGKEIEAKMFSLLWPSHEDALSAIVVNDMRDVAGDGAMYTPEVHELLHEMFSSKHGVDSVKRVGETLHGRGKAMYGDAAPPNSGGLRLMQSAFYSYQKVLLAASRHKHMSGFDFHRGWGELREDLYKGWNGVGDWVQ